jgi:hypothetical protein
MIDILDRAEEIDKQLNGYDYEKIDPEAPEVLRGINELEDIARNNDLVDIKDPRFSKLASKTRIVYSNWEFAVEERRAKKLKEDFKESSQIARTYVYAKEEGTAAGINNNSTLLFVGSGWVPESAIAYASVYDCNVTCVDCNKEAVDISKELIKNLKLDNRIKVVYAEAVDFDYRGYSHIELAVMALPKFGILKRIKDTSECNAKIICRTVEGSKSLLYTPTLPSDIEGFDILGVVRASNSMTIVNSIILMRKS